MDWAPYVSNMYIPHDDIAYLPGYFSTSHHCTVNSRYPPAARALCPGRTFYCSLHHLCKGPGHAVVLRLAVSVRTLCIICSADLFVFALPSFLIPGGKWHSSPFLSIIFSGSIDNYSSIARTGNQ